MGHSQNDYLDVECYSNYFLLSLLNSDTGATKDFELYDGKEFDSKTVTSIYCVLLKHLVLIHQTMTYR